MRGNCSKALCSKNLTDPNIHHVTGRSQRQQIVMKLHLARAAGRNLFSGYGTGYVAINGERYERNLIVLPDRIVDWEVARVEELSPGVFESLAKLPIDVLVLGTGGALRFPAPADVRVMAHAGIGVEVMDTPAACRTYNVLLSEDRRVAAALLVT